MRRTVHRFDLRITDAVQYVPVDSPDKIVLVAESDRISHGVAVWTEVNLDVPLPDRGLGVQVFGTGHPIPNDAVHLGSWSSGPFVWHLYAVSA